MADVILSPTMFGVSTTVFPLWIRILERLAAPLEVNIEITASNYKKTRVLWISKEEGRKVVLNFKGQPFSTEELLVGLLGDKNATRSLIEMNVSTARSYMIRATQSRWNCKSETKKRSFRSAISTIFSRRTVLTQEVTADETTRLNAGLFGVKESGARIKFTVKGRERFCTELIQQLLTSQNRLLTALFPEESK